MKVFIGPYKNWWGPYQIADLLQYVGFSKSRTHRIGRWLADTSLADLCEWIHARRKRSVKITVHDYDVWGMDNTIALIALPLLKRLKEKKQGSPHVDDEDVPEHLRSINAKPLTEEEANSGYPDNNFHLRWDWVIDEIIWGFENMIADDAGEIDFYENNKLDPEAHRKFHDRIQNAMCLFGKYLQGMWD
ncbi:hypothetical protein EBZ39_06330 [bacterium]|nr:hypothetical protein [bacterium]